MTAPVPVRAAVWTFRTLVALWPSRVTRRRRADIVALFAALAADAYRDGGPGGLASVWLHSVADLAVGPGRVTATVPRRRAVAARGRSHLLDDFRQDIRYAHRSLIRTPGFTLAAVVLLALGIGAGTAIFSVLHAVLLRPLPYPEPDRLVAVWSTPEGERGHVPLSAPDYYDWRKRSRSFDELGVQTLDWVNLSGAGRAERVRASICTASFLRALGVAPARGRLFTDGEEVSRGRVVVIGDALRRRRFGDAAEAVGRTLVVDGAARAVIGVMPPGFESPPTSPGGARAEAWLPLPPEPRERVTGSWRSLYAVGRLAPGVAPQAAAGDLAAIAADLARRYPDTNARLTAWVQPLLDRVVGDVRRPLWFLLAAVVVLLLVACANVAGLLLARSSTRQAELALRASLGAGRGRLVRQALTESVVLSAVGGAAGLLLAWWGLDALRGVMPGTIPRKAGIGIDGWVLACATTSALAAGILAGVAPALSAARLDLNAALRRGTPGGGRRRARAQHALLVAQFALALVLAHGAVLMLRSYLNVLGTPAGVDTAHTLVVGLTLRGERYDANEAAQAAFWARLLAGLNARPAVRAAGVASKLPFEGGTNGTLLVDGERYEADVRRPTVEKSFVSPGYFAAVGLPLVAGRPFRSVRPGDRVFELVVNQAFADRYWPGGSALGRAVRSNSPETNWSGTVVGVVGNARQWGLEAPPLPEIYYPMDVSSSATRNLVLSTEDPAALEGAVRDAVAAIDPDQPVSGFRTMGDVLRRSAAGRRFQTLLVEVFALVALAMVLAGAYAVTSYHVAARTREIGIRMALGAERAAVVAAVVRRGLALASLGAAIGAGGAVVSSRLTASLLYGVGPADPAAIAIVALLTVAIAVAGAALPARRAASVDPTVALRME